MQCISILTSIVLLAASSQAARAALPVSQTAAPDQVVLEMSRAFGSKNTKRLSALLPQARGHALEAWAAYWELRARLESASSEEIQQFFSRYAGSYQEDRLRNDYLLLLGQRRDWAAFSTELPKFRMNDDRQVRCYALAVDAANVDHSAEIKHEWFAQKDHDEGCAYAAGVLWAEKKISAADIWRKARLGMQSRRPAVVKAALDMLGRNNAQWLAKIARNDEQFLLKSGRTGDASAKEWALLALIHLALSDADRAAHLLQQLLGSQLNEEQRHWAWGVIGQQAARRLSEQALDYFAKVPAGELSDEQLGWRARAALRQGQWALVLTSVQAMSEQAAQEPVWVYWHGRAISALASSPSQRAQATHLLQGIAGVRGFYEQLALDELGQRLQPPAAPLPLSTEEKTAVRADAGLSRALLAIEIGLRSEGVREWNYVTRLHRPGGMSDRELLAAAELACERKVWDRCINASERTRSVVDFAQRFPLPYREVVLARSSQIGLDPAYVYGLIRQESRFVMNSRSSVGAAGLMQVMPATARWTAQKIGLVNFQPQQLSERDTNIAIGTGYLKLLLEHFDGSQPLAAAAYNAGPNRARSWRNAAAGTAPETAIWIENLPFSETRDYVKKVLANSTSYAALITGQPQSLKARLGTIAPASAALASERDLP